MQADAAEGLAQVCWRQQDADRHGYPHAFVTHLGLHAADVERTLDLHIAAKNFRFYELAAPYSESKRSAMFHDTAARFYRL